MRRTVIARCVSKLKPFLKSCGYLIKKEVKFIPISALTGANLKDPVSPADCPWWEKSCAAVSGSHGIYAMRCDCLIQITRDDAQRCVSSNACGDAIRFYLAMRNHVTMQCVSA